jgi:CRISPR/Cas system CSM-associated protein Csm3 (group 7 of RAMP superfamily)
MKKRIILAKGNIELLTPALIGSGKKDTTEMDVILDGLQKPFIPATSLVGVLRSHIQLQEEDKNVNHLNRFWGYTDDEDEDKGYQSAISCSDLKCISDSFKITVRDGIAIEGKTGMVKKTAKYDYQVIEPGAVFELRMEVMIKQGDNETFFKRMTSTILDALESGNIYIGAKTNNGLGKIKFTGKGVWEFDFTKKEDVKGWFKWLKNDDTDSLPLAKMSGPFELENQSDRFTVDALFKLKHSFIIRAYSEDPKSPDSVSLRSSDGFVISGSSLKGAIRSRAERILNTLNKNGRELDILDQLFGFAHEETKKKKKGKLRIKETVLNHYKPELQTRIKIDRFTGGTMEGALFDSMPLFSDNSDEKTFNINFVVKDFKPYEAGLLLLILKDLWTGDLAVGGDKNVGRGVFQGIEASIQWDKEPVTLTNKLEIKPRERKKDLETFVDSLVNHVKGD